MNIKLYWKNDIFNFYKGTTSFGGSTSNLLKNVKITTYDGSKFCTNYYPVDWSKQICAGDYYNGGKDTCQGDSGGPLYVLGTINGKNKYILAGVTSYGIGCGDKGLKKFFNKYFICLTFQLNY